VSPIKKNRGGRVAKPTRSIKLSPAQLTLLRLVESGRRIHYQPKATTYARLRELGLLEPVHDVHPFQRVTPRGAQLLEEYR
jgi:hypothetical protein